MRSGNFCVLNRIATIKTKRDLLNEVAHMHRTGYSALFNVSIDQDEKKSDEYAIHAYQGGLGLPDRDYYFKEDDRTKNIRTEYLKHIENMFVLLGDSHEAGAVAADPTGD